MNYYILGELERPTGEFTEDELPIMETITGFHVNTDQPIEGAEEYIVEPTVPRQVFAGVETFFYSFPDEAAFRQFISEEVLEDE